MVFKTLARVHVGHVTGAQPAVDAGKRFSVYLAWET